MDFTLFVYGTLKSGFDAHARWCRGTRLPIAAHTAGKLFAHPDGYPVLFVDPEAVLAVGSPEITHDTAIAFDASATRGLRAGVIASRPWTRAEQTSIHGELLSFPPGALRIADLDAYECYTPGAPSLFVRVLVEIALTGRNERRRAWTYVAGPLIEEEPLVPLAANRWPASNE